MINITDKHNCCGCSACVQRCPRQCISLIEDNEGFLYPHVNIDKCIDCRLCEKVCPIITPYKESEPLQAYALINEDDEVRMQSSSGGIFTLIANYVIEKHGVVFGATYDPKWNVRHIYIRDKSELAKFRGSKYLQSNINSTYKETEIFLKKGILVLFSGTSCQIAGLKHFLRKDYDNLITIDCICHGVPSPKVWQLYLKELVGRIENIKSISFRDKKTGWKNYSFTINLKDGTTITHLASKNIYMHGFLSNLYLRPSCEKCPSKSGRSGCDITLADYWGVNILNPDMDDDKGTSLILAYTEKGKNILKELKCKSKLISFEDAKKMNGGFKDCAIPHKKRKLFFEQFNILEFSILVSKCLHLSFRERLALKFYRIKKKLQYYL